MSAQELDPAEDAAAGARPMHHYLAGHVTTLAEEWRDLRGSGHLLYNLVHRDLTVRYKRSVLGFFWTMLHPLLLMLILMVVFSGLFRFALPHYDIYVLSGLLPWTFFAQTTATSMAAMGWNGTLMKRVRVPKTIFTLSILLAGLVNLLLSYVPLVVIMVVRGMPLRPAALFLPVSIAVLALFIFGISLFLSAVSVYFVDVREMFTVAVAALMYLTPVIYPMRIIPERFKPLIFANPLTYFIDLTRVPLYEGHLPTLSGFAIPLAIAVVTAAGGWMVFRRLARGFYPYL